MLNAWLVVARAMQFAAAVSLFGGLIFRSYVAPPVPDRDAGTASSSVAAWQWTLARSSLGMIAISGLMWLSVAATDMTGLSLGDAFAGGALPLVALHTAQGQLWVLRLALVILLAVLLIAGHRNAQPVHHAQVTLAALIVAGVLLASLAWSSHAAAVPGVARPFRLGVDAVHLLAAGAWVGGLPGLVMFLRTGPTTHAATTAIGRFSTLGMASVALILATGLVNTWYLVGSVPALVATPYGRLLTIKVALFAAMVVIASVNRTVLTPRIARGGAAASGELRRNALIELSAGLLIVCIVGVLGAMVPATHEMPHPAVHSH